MTGDIAMGDNVKAKFGAANDLAIYHNGQNSFIQDQGTGDFRLQTNGTAVKVFDDANSQLMAQFTTGGSVDLYHNGSKKLATTSTGIDVTGNLTLGANTVFHDTYHPNADKWTTARTLSLSGDASGSVSWDGSANATLSVTVADDSHTHDGRYYTESEADSRFVNVTGDTMSGNLNMGDNNVNGIGKLNFNNHEGSDYGVTGDVMFDENFYSDTEYGTAWSGSNGGGIAVYNEDGWGRILTDRNIQWHTATFDGLKVGSNSVFHDGYHPNADKWTTARSHTVTLTGDVTGTATQSVDGTGNRTWSISTTVGNDSHEHTRLQERSTITYGAGQLQWTDQSSNGGTGLNGSAPTNPTGDWYHHLVMNHANSGGYYVDLAACFHHDGLYMRRLTNGSLGSWNRFFADNYHPNADKWTTARTLSLSGDASGSVSWDGSSNATLSVTVDRIDNRTFRNGNSTSGISPDYITENGTGYINSVSLFGATDGALYSQAYNTSWVHQIFGDYRTGNIAVRGKNNGSWTSWRTVWNSGNDGSGSGLDADLLDGVQGSSFLRSDTADTASGDITFTGGAGAISVGAGSDIRFASGNWTGEHVGKIQYHADHFYFQSNSQWIFRTAAGANNAYIENNGRIQSVTDVRAPIFYDRNDTNYYGDFASTSRMNVVHANKLTLNGSYYGGMQNATLNIGSTGADFKYTSGWSGSMQAGILANCANDWEFVIHDSGTRLASAFAYEGASDRLRIGRDLGWGTSYTLMEESARSPIFYDSNNTAYYVNPSDGTTSARLNGDIYMTGGKIHVKRGTGLTTTIIDDDSSAGGRGQLLLDSHYSDLIIASRNSNGNKHGSTLTLATQSTSTNDYAKWVIGQGQYQEGADYLSFAYGTNTSNPHSVLGTDHVNFDFQIRNGGIVSAAGDMRAPIFYDINNTGYYLDPASTSRVNAIEADGFHAKDMGDFITFYGDNNTSHGIASRNRAGNAADDIRINSYGGVWINLDSNNNDTSDGHSSFYIGRHGGSTGTLTNDSLFRVYGDSLYAYSAYSFRAPIFYDSDNTGYYVNPASTSKLNSIYLEGAIYHNGDTNTYIQFHTSDQFRVVTGGSERLEVTNTQVTSTEPIHAPSFHGDGSSLSGIQSGANDDIFWENGQNVTSNYTITNGKNAMSAGPITVNSGVTVTVGDGETWTVV